MSDERWGEGGKICQDRGESSGPQKREIESAKEREEGRKSGGDAQEKKGEPPQGKGTRRDARTTVIKTRSTARRRETRESERERESERARERERERERERGGERLTRNAEGEVADVFPALAAAL